jgi:hypothetical protein
MQRGPGIKYKNGTQYGTFPCSRCVCVCVCVCEYLFPHPHHTTESLVCGVCMGAE